MSLDVDFAAKLNLILAGAGYAAVPVQQNYVSGDKTQPRVWYQRQAGNRNVFLDGTSADMETSYAVEVNGLDPDVADAIADTITAGAAAGGLNGFRGQMLGTIVLGAFVEDASDDYQPRGLQGDDGYHVFAFTVRILT